MNLYGMEEIGPDEVMQAGDLAVESDGYSMTIEGWAGYTLRQVASRPFTWKIYRHSTKYPLCENCYTRHAPGENELCEL